MRLESGSVPVRWWERSVRIVGALQRSVELAGGGPCNWLMECFEHVERVPLQHGVLLRIRCSWGHMGGSNDVRDGDGDEDAGVALGRTFHRDNASNSYLVDPMDVSEDDGDHGGDDGPNLGDVLGEVL